MFEPETKVEIDGTWFLINGEPTYAGRPKVEGLLYNVRTVNATFDDTDGGPATFGLPVGPSGDEVFSGRQGGQSRPVRGDTAMWDDPGTHPENDFAGYGPWKSPESAEANTRRYIAGLPEYRAHGVLMVNLNVQGGHPLHGRTDVPDWQGSAQDGPTGMRSILHNSGFRSDGSLEPLYFERIASVIEACDELGMVVNLQLFYFGQDTVFTEEAGVLVACDNTVVWLADKGYANVTVEIANEVMKGHYHHKVLKPARVHELIERLRSRARERDYPLYVSTSEAALLSEGQWSIDDIDRTFSVSDLVFLHGNAVDEVQAKVELIRGRPWYRERPVPIVFNETGGGLPVFRALLAAGISFGLHSRIFQTMWPPKWGVWDNETKWFFEVVKEVTAGGQGA